MKRALIFLVLMIVAPALRAQDALLLKSWIKTKVENLSKAKIPLDTGYLRYTFYPSNMTISFVPSWEGLIQHWKLNKKRLSLDYETYDIEKLTDSSLVLKVAGFRRISFLAENYLRDQKENLDSIGIYKGKPVYRVSKFITPRYLSRSTLKSIEPKHYNLLKASTFSITFIVTENGTIENIKVRSSINKDFDQMFIENLQKTSGTWSPAMYQSKAIQTEMTYQSIILPMLQLVRPKNAMN